MTFVHHVPLWIYELWVMWTHYNIFTRLHYFRMCLHRQFFFPMRFVKLLNAEISWIFVCRASFRQVTALNALSGYFLSTHTMLSIIKSKSYCLLLFKKCKIVVARDTYFISLKDVSFASKNQWSKHWGHSRNRTCDHFIRIEMLYSTELCVHVGTGNATYQSRFGRCRQKRF